MAQDQTTRRVLTQGLRTTTKLGKTIQDDANSDDGGGDSDDDVNI